MQTEVAQHTEEWYKRKLELLGANDITCILNNGYFDKDELIHRKIHYTDVVFEPEVQERVDRGTRYESVVRELCGLRNKCKIAEVGQRIHPRYDYITASPDGVGFLNKKTLFEFKVRGQLDYKIPFKYWIQTQIQMEVFDIDYDMYCENLIHEYSSREEYLADSGTPKPRGELLWEGKVYYWKLDSYYEVLVPRDRQWFKTVLPEISKAWQIISLKRQLCGSKRKRQRERRDTVIKSTLEHEYDQRYEFYTNRDKMIAPYNITNWILDDPILDWLDIYGDPVEKDKRPPFDLSKFIYEQAINFRIKMRDYLKERTPADKLIDIDEQYQPIDPVVPIKYDNQKIYYDNITKTQEAINSQIPIIFNACLYSPEYGRYGQADILGRVDYLDELLEAPDVFSDKESKYYVIIATKFSTLNLRVDEMHLLSNSKQNIYKAHLALLNVCLGQMQGHTVSKSLIIGRKSEAMHRGEKRYFKNSFKRLGVVDFAELDSVYLEKLDDAIDWIHSLRESKAAKWKPGEADLKPNMKNIRDFPWHSYKKTLATETKEITQMYKCGVKRRRYAEENGADTWDTLTLDTINTKGAITLQHINNFIESNVSRTDLNLDKIRVGTESVGVDLVTNMPAMEFFVDFEAVNDLGDDFSKFPQVGGTSMIYMIGCLLVNNKTGQKIHNTFIVDRLTKDCELTILKQWYEFMVTAARGQTRKIYVYHWGNAENYMLRKACTDHKIEIGGLVLVDLCDAFRRAFAVVSDTFGYGIKQIGKTLHKAGKISTVWLDNIDGGGAMVAAWKAHEICIRDDCIFTDIGFIKDMVKYNYIDCKVMQEIISYLRSLD